MGALITPSLGRLLQSCDRLRDEKPTPHVGPGTCVGGGVVIRSSSFCKNASRQKVMRNTALITNCMGVAHARSVSTATSQPLDLLPFSTSLSAPDMPTGRLQG